MKRIYSYYDQETFNLIEEEAKKRGMSMSAYQKYVVSLSLPKSTQSPRNTQELIQHLHTEINNMKPGDTFIVSTPFEDEWSTFSLTEKKSLAMQLSAFAKSHPDVIEKVKQLPGKIWQYKRI